MNCVRCWITPVLLFAFAAVVFVASKTPTSAQDFEQNQRRPTYRARENDRRIQEQVLKQHFKSGAQLSEAILRDIAKTLERIDQRLERLEKLVDTTKPIQSEAIPSPNRRPR